MRHVTDITIDTYNAVAGEYSEKYSDDTSDFAYIGEFISNVTKCGRVLDIGCGPGQFSKFLSAKGFDVIGIDLSDAMLDIAKKSVPECAFQEMDMRSLTFTDEYFDGIIAPYSMIHIPDEEVVNTLKEWYRVLKPGGYLNILVQEGESDHWVSQPFAPEKQIFFNFFTVERLQQYLHLSGFNTVNVQKVACEDALSLCKNLIYILGKKP